MTSDRLEFDVERQFVISRAYVKNGKDIFS